MVVGSARGSGHGQTRAPDLHGGHSGGTAAAEVQGKVLAYGGSMLAVGLAILAWLVLRPALGRIPRGAAYGSGIALLAGAAGCLLLVVVAADSLPGGGARAGGTDYVGFATTTRIGLLLSARTVVGAIGGVVVLVVARLGGGRGAGLGLALGGAAGTIGLGLTAAGGHASAFSSPVPVAMDVVHLAAASVWLGGLVHARGAHRFRGEEPARAGRAARWSRASPRWPSYRSA